MSRRRFSATIEISALGSSADAICSALKPDVISSPERQVGASIRLDYEDRARGRRRGAAAGSVRIDVSSDDLSHLRAGLNSYLRLARAALGCLDATTL